MSHHLFLLLPSDTPIYSLTRNLCRAPALHCPQIYQLGRLLHLLARWPRYQVRQVRHNHIMYQVEVWGPRQTCNTDDCQCEFGRDRGGYAKGQYNVRVTYLQALDAYVEIHGRGIWSRWINSTSGQYLRLLRQETWSSYCCTRLRTTRGSEHSSMTSGSFI